MSTIAFARFTHCRPRSLKTFASAPPPDSPKAGSCPVRSSAAAALERTGYEPRFILSGGGADANVFNERGLQCVNLANAMVDIHTPDERIAVADLEAMVDVTLALVDVAAEAMDGAA